MNHPRISIIVPSFNQGAFIEETLLSALEQNYPALELIVMDGGSTDNTVDVLRKFGDRIALWESTKDRGQTHAINKGLARSTGEIWAYLNSDDLLAPGSLHRAAELFQNPAVEWIGGISEIFDYTGPRDTVTPQEPARKIDYLTPWKRKVQHVFSCSNVTYMRRSLYEKLGPLDETYHYSMDMEYYTRAIFSGVQFHRIPEVLGRWRWHEQCKTVKDGNAYRFTEEEIRIAESHTHHLPAEQQAELAREIAIQKKWFAVRQIEVGAMPSSRAGRLASLIRAAVSRPSLIVFRPWLGAVRRQFFGL
jgi:glycosyltransferase involved in cell wall biosynthesis